METPFAVFAINEVIHWLWNPLITGGFSSKLAVVRSFGVLFDVNLNKLLQNTVRLPVSRNAIAFMWVHCDKPQVLFEFL